MRSTFCLPRFCLGSAPVGNRSRTGSEPRQNRGRQKVEHTCVEPFAYLCLAWVLRRVGIAAEAKQNRGNTEVDKKVEHPCVLPVVYLCFVLVLLRFGAAAEPKQNRGKTVVDKR